MEIQLIGSEKYNQLKREIEELEGKKHPVVIQPVVEPTKPSDNGGVLPDDDEDEDKKRRMEEFRDLLVSIGEAGNSL